MGDRCANLVEMERYARRHGDRHCRAKDERMTLESAANKVVSRVQKTEDIARESDVSRAMTHYGDKLDPLL